MMNTCKPTAPFKKEGISSFEAAVFLSPSVSLSLFLKSNYAGLCVYNSLPFSLFNN